VNTNRYIALLLAATMVVVAGNARADNRTSDSIITMPTATIRAAPSITGRVRIDHRGAASGQVALSLGGIAQLSLDTDRDLRTCATCDSSATPQPTRLGHADFRMAVPHDAWFRRQPAMALGVRVTWPTSIDSYADLRAADVYAVASEQLGPVRLHAGAIAQNIASQRGDTGLQLASVARVRPMLGIEWNPAPYPRTTVVADITWIPELINATAKQTWLAGWGVRYWAGHGYTVELAVRHRQDEGLASTTVLIGARFGFGAE
jgi:hypothetical protein